MATAGRRVGTLIQRLGGCMQESRIASVVGSHEGDAAGQSLHVCGNLFVKLRTLGRCGNLSTSSEGFQRLFRPDHTKRSSSVGGEFVRLASAASSSSSSGTTSHSASAKAAAESAGIREQVKKIKEEAQFNEGVKNFNEDLPEGKKIHEGVQTMKEDSSEGKARAAKEERKEQEEVVDEKTKTLRAALAHVPKLGWTEAALIAGARDVGLSPAIVGAFPRKEAALVEFFMDECALALAEELEEREEEMAKMVLNDRVAAIVWMRLEMQIPYLSKWAQALSIQASPLNVPTTVKQRALLVDDIWHAAGDRSADMDWYAKRALLAGVYSTTELYMLTDTSPGFRDTKTFLGRRIADAIDYRKSVQEASQLAQALGAGFQKTVNSLLNSARSPTGFKF